MFLDDGLVTKHAAMHDLPYRGQFERETGAGMILKVIPMDAAGTRA